jgi:alpha-beta hydrolase superfamily lysophospholipase
VIAGGPAPGDAIDWDDAYANVPHIPQGSTYPARWIERARAFRDEWTAAGRARTDLAYGPAPRNRLDLLLPDARCNGLVVFVHGGFWRAFDKSSWSHLANGSLAAGYAVAMPSYSLCPEVRISDITKEIAVAVEYAAREVPGDILLCGHSAGGHLVTRMVCEGSPLGTATASRIGRTVSISGLHDLRPLLATGMNGVLRLDQDEAERESPALLRPRPHQTVTCWVGADERPEFVRQNRLLAETWTGFDARMAVVEEPDRHHFDVIDGLAEAGHPLVQALLVG